MKRTTGGKVLGALVTAAGLVASLNADYGSRDEFKRVGSDVGATCDDCPWYEFTDSLVWGIAGPLLTLIGVGICVMSFLLARDRRRAPAAGRNPGLGEERRP